MTTIITNETPSIQSGPRGLQARTLGGTYTQDSQIDIGDGDCFQIAPTVLTGTTDAIPGFASGIHFGGNYVIETGAIDAITLPVPTAEIDDNLSLSIFSDTAFAHTVTLPGAFFAKGTAGLGTTATFTAGRGAGLILRAWNGTWQVLGQPGVAIA